MPGMIERRHRRLLLALAAPDAYAHVGMPQVGTNLDIGYIHAREARILQFKSDKFRQLFTNRFRYPLSTMLIHGNVRCGPTSPAAKSQILIPKSRG